jgi:hypothetical protein
MGERWLLWFLERARGSKGGVLLTIVGVFLLFFTLVVGFVSMAGDALLVMTGTAPVIDFLGTGQGVLVGFAVAVFITLLGVAFLVRATPQPTQSVSVIQHSGTSQVERDREVERLRKRLGKTEQDRDRLAAILADPTAKRRRDEEMLKRRCIDLAQEVEIFRLGNSSQWQDEGETVTRFKLRHESKVTDLHDELDEHGMLTAKERESLTLSAHDGLDKIKRMATTLEAIGMGR